MNPHLLYSQAVKGRSSGRSIGVIDTVHFAEVALGVEALRKSKSLTASEDAAVTGWFRDYLAWIRPHPYGVEESNAKNNHGACWTVQAAGFARLVGDSSAIKPCLPNAVPEALHRNSSKADRAYGRFPQELARTALGGDQARRDVVGRLAGAAADALVALTWGARRSQESHPSSVIPEKPRKTGGCQPQAGNLPTYPSLPTSTPRTLAAATLSPLQVCKTWSRYCFS